MSGLGDPSGTRLVPMTEYEAKKAGVVIWDRWEASPADPAEAIRGALLSTHIYSYDESDVQARTEAYVDALAVLVALGVPANPANEDHHA